MKKLAARKKKNNKGFSLVELIVVIAIMAVLIGILAPQFFRFVENSRQSTDIKNVQEVVSAIQVAASNGTTMTDGSTVTLTDTSTAVGTACSNADLAAALTDAGITNLSLSSDHWAGDVVVTVHVDADGIVSMTVSPAVFATDSGIPVTP